MEASGEGDYAISIDIATSDDIQPAAAVTGELSRRIRAQARGLIEGLIKEVLELALGRPRYGRQKEAGQVNGVAFVALSGGSFELAGRKRPAK